MAKFFNFHNPYANQLLKMNRSSCSIWRAEKNMQGMIPLLVKGFIRFMDLGISLATIIWQESFKIF
jgi:hypothetical protein